MRWALTRVTFTSAGRRAGAVLVANPLLALLGGLLVLATPVASVAGGRALGRELGPAIGEDPGIALGVTLTFGFVGALLGGTVAALAAGSQLLSAQVACAPISRRRFAIEATGIPALAVVTLAAGILSFALVPLAAATPGGAWTAPALLAAALAGVAAGAVLLEASAHVLRGGLAGVGALGALATVWTATALFGDAPLLTGPLGLAAEALEDGGLTTLAAVAVGSTCAAGFAALWLELLVRRPTPRAQRQARRAMVRVPRSMLGATAVSTGLRLVRRPELRRQAALVVGASAGGTLLLSAVVPAAGSFVFTFCAGAAALGAAAWPLAVGGADREAAWLWRAAPVRSLLRAVTVQATGILVGILVLAVATMPVALVTGASGQQVVDLLGIALVLMAVASLVGALVPWRANRMLDQLATYGAFAAFAGALWFGLGWLAERLAAGIGDAAVGFLVPATVLVTLPLAAAWLSLRERGAS